MNQRTAETTIPPAFVSRRSHPRMCCQPTLVHVHLDGYDKPVEARLIDVSMTGLQLNLFEPLPVGALITIDTGHMVVTGEVRRCDKDQDYNYAVGVLMRDVSSER